MSCPTPTRTTRILAQVAEETFTWTWVNVLLLVASIIGYFVFVLVYAAIYPASPEFYGVAVALFSRGVFWLILLLAFGIVILLNFFVEYIRREWFYSPVDVEMERERCDGVWWTVVVGVGGGG